MAAACAAVAPSLLKAEAPIPLDMKMYEVAGQTIFPRYGGDSYLTRAVCAFPILLRGKSILMFGYEVDGLSLQQASFEEYAVRIRHDSMAMFASALRSGQTIIERRDGDLLPRHGEVVRYTLRRPA